MGHHPRRSAHAQGQDDRSRRQTEDRRSNQGLAQHHDGRPRASRQTQEPTPTIQKITVIFSFNRQIMSVPPTAVSSVSTVYAKPPPWKTALKWGILVGLLALLGVVAWMIYKRQHPSPPPPPSEVFGVEMKDFRSLFDRDITVMPDGSFQFNRSLLKANSLNGTCPSGFSVATIDQLQAAAYRGMQYCAWGICQDSSSTRILGTYPMQVGINNAGTTLCGIYSVSNSSIPRVMKVVSTPSDVTLPNVIWMYGVKPVQGTVFRFITDDVSLPGRTIFPWYQPLSGESRKVQWKYDSSVPIACGTVGKSCLYPLATIYSGTQMFLSYSTSPGLSFPYLTLTTTQGPFPVWQFTPDGNMLTPLYAGASVGAVSYPTAYESLPLSVLTFPSPTSIPLQPPQEGSSGVTPTGASYMTMNPNGTITLTAYPKFGLGYGTVSGLPGSFVIMTATPSNWLKFSPAGWTDVIQSMSGSS